MVRKTLLYIGHPYHLRSKSADFLKQRLEEEFDIDYIESNSDCTFPEETFNSILRERYDICLCWQVMPSVTEIRKRCSFKHGVFFPMADYYYGLLPVDMPIWREYADFRIILFSRKLYDEIKARGFDAEYVQYFPKPAEVKDFGDERGVWFWQRVTHLNAYTILSVLKDFPIRRLHIHKSVDPREQFVLLPTDYQRGFGVSYSTWYDTRADMLADMDKYAIYFAPRPIEGIGLSYLEAMAHGRCVIANDDTCANEYIRHGETGFLYDWQGNGHNAIELEPADVRRIQKNALEFIRAGYVRWREQLKNLPSLFFKPIRIDEELMKRNQKIWANAKGLSCPMVQDPSAAMHGQSVLGRRTLRDRLGALRRLWGNHDEGGEYFVARRKRLLGLPIFRKDVRSDGKRVKFRILGIPLIRVDVV